LTDGRPECTSPGDDGAESLGEGRAALRVAVAGATGWIGTHLCRSLRARGDEVFVLTRGPANSEQVLHWDYNRGISQLRRLEGVDAFVNLTGEPLATRPWTAPRREQLISSRVGATEVLHTSLSRLDRPPSVVVGLGFVGLFGDRGNTWLEDDAPPGEGFLADLAARWETVHLTATDRFADRASVLRLSIVLGADGGVFPPMLAAFRLGLGGWLGDGRQYTPWTSMRDTVGAIQHLLDTPGCEGAYNGTVPDPCTHREWCETLARLIGRPARAHAPKWALRGALGDLADQVLLASCRARPRRLLEAGYTFVDPRIEPTYVRMLAEHEAAPR
jgi:uncharacterized protein (TIGR01777 family)